MQNLHLSGVTRAKTVLIGGRGLTALVDDLVTVEHFSTRPDGASVFDYPALRNITGSLTIQSFASGYTLRAPLLGPNLVPTSLRLEVSGSGAGFIDLGSAGGGIVGVGRQGTPGSTLLKFASVVTIVGVNIQFFVEQSQIMLSTDSAVPWVNWVNLPIVAPAASDTNLFIQNTNFTRLDLNITGKVNSLRVDQNPNLQYFPRPAGVTAVTGSAMRFTSSPMLSQQCVDQWRAIEIATSVVDSGLPNTPCV